MDSEGEEERAWGDAKKETDNAYNVEENKDDPEIEGE